MELKYTNAVFNINQILDEKIFTFPNFQRGISWKINRKQNFIKTLLNGEPFGTILIYEDNKDTYLIDGLQRITTIREFYNDKYAFLTDDIIDDSYAKDIAKEIRNIYKRNKLKTDIIKTKLDVGKIKSIILKKIQKNKGNYEGVMVDLKKYFKLDSIPESHKLTLNSILKKVINNINKLTNISNLKIYAIVYTGDKNRLPDIFYNLNTGGTVPSKYEVLASLWNKITYKIKDEEIIDAVYDRYKLLKNLSQLKVTIKKEDLKRDGITLFEYCYAIGKIIYSDRYDFASFLGKSNDNIEPLSFSIISMIVGLNENEANKIGKKLSGVAPKFLIDLKKAIIDGFEVVNEGLKYWIKSERVTPKSSVNYNNVNSNYMIYHIFMAYIRKNYIIDVEKSEIRKIKRVTVDNWNKQFIKNVHLHYFYDFISDYWVKNRQVKDLMENIKNEDKLFKYSYEIPKEDWNRILNDFKNEQLSYFGSSFHKKTKLFLEYLIKFKIRDNEELKKKYFISKKTKEPLYIEIEHIVPVGRIEERNLLKDVPVYSLGNACYLTSKVNGGKHEKTIYEWIEEKPGIKVDEEFFKFVNYPREEELENFIKAIPTIFKNEYIIFLSNRLDQLIEDFKKYMI